MATMLKRLFWLALLGGAGFAVWSMIQRRNAGPPSAAPDWPPIQTDRTSETPPAARDESDRAPEAFAGVGATTHDASADGPGTSDTATGDHAAGDDTEVSITPSTDRWIEPVDGACPVSHPIKANDNSRIFHVPGGRFYERTGPERCYARAEDAEADGYRAAKS